MTAQDLERIGADRCQRLYYAYCEIIAAIEDAHGGPSNVRSDGEYWAAVSRRNLCRRVFKQLMGGDDYEP